MDLISKDVQNEISDIELGDVIYCGKLDEYYIVIYDYGEELYYLKSFDGDNTLFSYGEHDSLESLRGHIVISDGLKFTHYPAKEYRLELVRKPNMGGEN